mgnify:CR=1 FL=1
MSPFSLSVCVCLQPEEDRLLGKVQALLQQFVAGFNTTIIAYGHKV